MQVTTKNIEESNNLNKPQINTIPETKIKPYQLYKFFRTQKKMARMQNQPPKEEPAELIGRC